jgi:DNA-binding PadR family transcriptional regulator
MARKSRKSRPANPLALAVLALLFERPMHPYEMGILLKQRHKEDSIKFRYGSLYTVIDLLLERGCIVARETAREGRRPERTVYELTAAGGEELHAWMADLIGQPSKEYPQFEAALCLLPVLPPDEALSLLRRRLELMDDNAAVLSRQIEQIAGANFPPLFLVESEYRLAVIKAERDFVAGLIARIEKGWGPRQMWQAFHQDRAATIAKLYRQLGVAPMG